MIAGSSTANAQAGGKFQLVGGEGSSLSSDDGGDGGNIQVQAGPAQGTNEFDLGGDTSVEGGSAVAGTGVCAQ